MDGKLHHLLRGAQVVAGMVWAGLLVMAGLWLWEHNPLPRAGGTLGLVPIAAGQFVFMHLVADALCPGTLPDVTGFLKLTAALVFVLALGFVLGLGLSTVVGWQTMF